MEARGKGNKPNCTYLAKQLVIEDCGSEKERYLNMVKHRLPNVLQSAHHILVNRISSATNRTTMSISSW
jgi:hypothetical protein